VHGSLGIDLQQTLLGHPKKVEKKKRSRRIAVMVTCNFGIPVSLCLDIKNTDYAIMIIIIVYLQREREREGGSNQAIVDS
jgi:hypothetical protein